jgi:transcriptional regulator with XRE-family HTH domain
MSFKSLRGSVSQARLAELSGLSLSTIHRVEAGNRVSYASLQALAATFAILMTIFRVGRGRSAVVEPTRVDPL